MILEKKDKQIANLILAEKKRQEETINLIASENYPSPGVKEALSSVFVSKYSEGRPFKRYYGGMENIDKLETLVEERTRIAFGLDNSWAINVQPYSGSPANYAIYRGLLNLGDKILSLSLDQGGHLTHGSLVSLSGIDFKIIHYNLNRESNLLDYEEMEKTAFAEKPKIIIAGFTAYSREIDFKKISEIAKRTGAYFLADISHIAGLVIGGVHQSPFPFADVVMTTTHKTLRGPRGAIIICKEELKSKIFPKVFPGLQGGPHNHTICAIGVALKEATSSDFKKYSLQIIKNAKALAEELKKYEFKLISGGTDNHLILIDLTNKNISGKEAQVNLEKAGIVLNKNTIPYDTRSPFDPSGIRLGVAAITTRGMKEKEMKKIAFWINDVISNPKSILIIKKEIKTFCKKFLIW